MTKKTLFISDLHLTDSNLYIFQELKAFLNKYLEKVDALYILGDLFEAWIGDDHLTPFNQEVINLFCSLTRNGLPVFFLHGNRDFFIGKKFLKKTGCVLIADEEKIDLYGTPVLLMHGDTLCTQDVTYLKARRIAKSWWFKILFLSLPLVIRKMIAEKMRVKSQNHKKKLNKQIMDVTKEEVNKLMRKYDVTYLIHGHTHRPKIHSFILDQKSAERIVLGSWDHHAKFLIWDETGHKKLDTFYFNSNFHEQ